MKAEKRNHLWLAIICFILAGLLVVVHASQGWAQDKPPSPPPVNNQVIKSSGVPSMDKPPTPPPQEMLGEQTTPSGAGDMYPPTNPLATEQSVEVGESTADSVNIPSSHGKTTGEIQKAPPVNANSQKPTYEIKLDKGCSTPDKAIPQRSLSR